MIVERFFNGHLNLDVQAYRLPKEDYSDALNITRDAQGAGQDRVVSNIKGNQQVSHTLPEGTNKRIGSHPDNVRNRLYYFVWNSNGYNTILYYDVSTNTIVELLQSITDTSGVDILGFDPSWKINHVDIIYRDEGDLLFWTDGLNNPFFLNVTDAENDLYGSNWIIDYITVNRPMSLLAATCSYEDDSSVELNNLRKKLYQFKYRYVYSNFEKSCWSPISKLFAPANPDDIATDIDPTKNNRIDVIVNTGNEDVTDIEIAARQSIDTTFSDFFLVTTLNKEELSIPSNSVYTYEFFNDSSYPYIDIKESLLLFSQVPNKAYTQANPNGNVIVYGATTEGYDFDETLDVDSEVTSIDNSDNIGLTINVVNSFYHPFLIGSKPAITYIFSGGVDGVVSVTLNFSATNAIGTVTNASVSYTLNPGDGITQIINGLFSQFPISDFSAIDASDAFNTLPPDSILIYFSDIFSYTITGTFTITTSGNNPTDINISCYKHKARYSWGLVYFDKDGVTDGVHYQPETMNLIMPELSTTGGTASTIPQITFTVNHQPPIWAYYFAWVRTTNLTFLSSLGAVSLTTKIDNGGQFAYLEITNLQTNENGYPTYEFTAGDRVRIVGVFVSGAAGTVNEHDFPIVDLLVDPTINGTKYNGSFLKVPYNSVLSSFGSSNPNWYIEIYTPAPNTNKEQQVFYEFGENYSVIDPGTLNRAHSGMTQDQIIGTQPAIYNFIRGDFYERTRLYHTSQVSSSNLTLAWILSQSVSDQYPSQVQSIGRAFVVDADAKEIYYPALVRFGQEYQENTNINRLNIFFPENFDQYDRSNGDIRKLFIEQRYMYVFQKFDVGVVPVLTQIVTDTAGNPLQAQSDVLLNKIVYPYKGKYGIGNVPESFYYHEYAKYFVDPTKRVVIRLSQDGITVLSVLYECNAFFQANLAAYNPNLNNGVGATGEAYTGNPTVYGCFDFYTNKYILALEEINRYDYVLAVPDSAPTAAVGIAGGLPDGTYSVKVTFVDSSGNESATSEASNEVSLVAAGAGKVSLSNIPIGGATVIERRIYTRFTSGIFDSGYLLSNTISDNVTTTLSSISYPTGDAPQSTTELSFHQDPYTIIFNETRDESEGFETFASYHPEGMDSIGTLLVSFKDGAVWTHDNDTYCSFYGVNFPCYIKGVFNDNMAATKTFISVQELSNKIWACPSIETSVNTYGTTSQSSQLVSANFSLLESKYSSSFLRDINSQGGLINGSSLKGIYIMIKFNIEDASSFSFLNSVSLKYIDSPLNIS